MGALNRTYACLNVYGYRSVFIKSGKLDLFERFLESDITKRRIEIADEVLEVLLGRNVSVFNADSSFFELVIFRDFLTAKKNECPDHITFGIEDLATDNKCLGLEVRLKCNTVFTFLSDLCLILEKTIFRKAVSELLGILYLFGCYLAGTTAALVLYSG